LNRPEDFKVDRRGPEGEHAVVAHRDREQVHAETVQAWRRWLVDNHRTADGVWLVSWKSATGKARIGYAESVVEALAVGWVDGNETAERASRGERANQWPRT
jgi:hypothetical protein